MRTPLLQTGFKPFRFLFSGEISRFWLVLLPEFWGSPTISIMAGLILISPTVSETPFPHILFSVHYLLLLGLVTLTRMSYCLMMCIYEHGVYLMFMQVYVNMDMHVFGGHRTISNLISQMLLTVFIDIGSSLAWNLPSMLGCLATEPGIYLPPSPQHTGIIITPAFYTLVLGIILTFPCLQSWAPVLTVTVIWIYSLLVMVMLSIIPSALAIWFVL